MKITACFEFIIHLVLRQFQPSPYLFNNFFSPESLRARIAHEWPVDSEAQWTPWSLKLWTTFSIKSSSLWFPWIFCFGSLPSLWFFLLRLLRRFFCPAHPLKAGGRSYHLWTDFPHVYICSPVTSPALMSSTSDHFWTLSWASANTSNRKCSQWSWSSPYPQRLLSC